MTDYEHLSDAEANNVSLSELVTEAYRPVIRAYTQFIRDCAQEIRSDHSLEKHSAESPSSCEDCREQVTYAADSEWSIYTRNAYLVMIISPNRDAWMDISSDIDSFGETLDACMTAAAAIAIEADISDELERLG